MRHAAFAADSPSKMIVEKIIPPSDYRTKSLAELETILQRVGEADQVAVREFIDAYGNLVWTLARKHTDSPEEAETATQKIFLDIWYYAERYDPTKIDPTVFIFLIARRHLIMRSKLSQINLMPERLLDETVELTN